MVTHVTPERWPNESAASLTPLPAVVVLGRAAWLPFSVLLWLLTVTAWNCIKTWSSLAESKDMVCPLPCFQLAAWEHALGQAALLWKRSLHFSLWSKRRKLQEEVVRDSKRGALDIGLCTAGAKKAAEMGSWPCNCSKVKVTSPFGLVYAQVGARRRGHPLPDEVFVVVPPRHGFVLLGKEQNQGAKPAEK